MLFSAAGRIAAPPCMGVARTVYACLTPFPCPGTPAGVALVHLAADDSDSAAPAWLPLSTLS